MTAPGSYILLTLRIVTEEHQVVAYCLELGLASYGASFEDARDRALESVEAVLHTMDDRGDLEAYLEGKGIQLHSRDSKPEARMLPAQPDEWVGQLRVPAGAGA